MKTKKVDWKQVWKQFEHWFSKEAKTVPSWKAQQRKIEMLIERSTK